MSSSSSSSSSRTVSYVGAAAVALALIASTAAPAHAASGRSDASQDESFSFAVIGDVPYGSDQFSRFPAMVSELNEQDELRFVSHVGDIKAGSAKCTDDYFAAIKAQFDRFEAPLVYTPGDNEWVDCHRANNGSYDPLERLDTLRSVFFSSQGKTLGANMPVTVPDPALPENVLFGVQRVAFSVLNVQGSNNSLMPWTGLGLAEPTAAQLDEVATRTAADIEQLERTFADAKLTNARAVVVMTQADMFDPFLLGAGAAEHPELVSGFGPIVEALAEGAREFGGEVYLFNGDSHVFTDDSPLSAGSPWLGIYGQDEVENLRRVTVEGAATSNEWLRVSVRSNSGSGEGVLSWERVPYTAP